MGVVLACVLLLLILACCWFQRRRALQAAASAKTTPPADGKQDSVYVHGIKVAANGAVDTACVDSPEHVEKMKKLQNMAFQRTKTGTPKQIGAGPFANSPGAEGSGKKGFAFPDQVSQAGGAFGSPVSTEPVYTPRGSIVSKLFSPKMGLQVSLIAEPPQQCSHCSSATS